MKYKILKEEAIGKVVSGETKNIYLDGDSYRGWVLLVSKKDARPSRGRRAEISI